MKYRIKKALYTQYGKLNRDIKELKHFMKKKSMRAGNHLRATAYKKPKHAKRYIERYDIGLPV